MKTITISFESYEELKKELKLLLTLLDVETKEETEPEPKKEPPKKKKRGRPPKKKEPEPEPEETEDEETEDEEETEETEYTAAEVKKALNKYAQEYSIEDAYARLADFGADEFDDLDPAAYGNLVEALKTPPKKKK